MSEDHIVVGLDMGNSTGWCFVKNGIIKNSGMILCKDKLIPHPGAPFVNFNDQVLERFKRVDEIVYEKVTFASYRAQSKLYDGMLSQLQAHSYRYKIRLVGIPNSTLKKEFAGHGHAEKKDMCAVAHNMGWKHGEPGTDLDHDECDAIACATVHLRSQSIIARFE